MKTIVVVFGSGGGTEADHVQLEKDVNSFLEHYYPSFETKAKWNCRHIGKTDVAITGVEDEALKEEMVVFIRGTVNDKRDTM